MLNVRQSFNYYSLVIQFVFNDPKSLRVNSESWKILIISLLKLSDDKWHNMAGNITKNKTSVYPKICETGNKQC